MPPRFKKIDRDQPLLFSSALGDLIPQDHQVRLFVEAIENLNIPLEKFHINYTGSGEEQYPPVMMLTLIIYCCANRIFSYRDIEKATYDVVPVRFITGNLHPDFRTIGYFRERNAEVFTETFLEVINIAKTAGLVTLGEVSLDSSQFKANASKARNYSIETIEHEKNECHQILNQLLEEEAKAQKEDKTPTAKDLPDDLNTPQKRTQAIKKAKLRLENLKKAEKALEKRAEEEFNKDLEKYNATMAQRKAKEEQGQKIYGRIPQKPTEKKYNVNWQGNSTDPDSRLMTHRTKRSAISQSYNVQTIVDNASRLIVAGVVTNNASDGGQLLPMIQHLEDTVGTPKTVLADQGYINAPQMQTLENANIEILIPVGRKPIIDKHVYRIADQGQTNELSQQTTEQSQSVNEQSESTNPTPQPTNPPSDKKNKSSDDTRRSLEGRLLTGCRNAYQPNPSSKGFQFVDPYLVQKQEQMEQEKYRQRYNRRNSTIEPIFGIIKNVCKIVQFRHRGRAKVQTEITIGYLTYNLKRLFALGIRIAPQKR